MSVLSPQKRVGCACPEHTDRVTCYDLRYYGRSPVNRGPTAYRDPLDVIEGNPDLRDDDGYCECYCHEECERDYDDE